MDQELINKVYDKIKTHKRNTHHIVLQIHTALDVFIRTGNGKEILEHYLIHSVRYLDKVYYFRDKVYDFNEHEIEKWSRANRHKTWCRVDKYYHNRHVKKYFS
jgi:hypothetical protein